MQAQTLLHKTTTRRVVGSYLLIFVVLILGKLFHNLTGYYEKRKILTISIRIQVYSTCNCRIYDSLWSDERIEMFISYFHLTSSYPLDIISYK